MIRRAFAIAVGLLVTFTVSARAAETAIPPAPTRWVTDNAGFISPATRTALDTRLESYQQTTGHQVIVWIAPTLGDSPLEEWCAKAFAAWGLGRKGKDDGVGIFVFSADHKMRIEVGYGVEDLLPDAYAARIVREVMAPALQAGHPDQAITDAVDQVLSRLGNETNGTVVPALPALPAHHQGPSAVWIVLGILAAIFVVFFAITHPALAWVLLQILSSGGGGGGGFGGGGGGGFSGGGGRSGGGGASGSW